MVKEFDSIAALKANPTDPFSTPTFSAYVAAYYCLSGTPCPPVVADGGEGLFVAGGTGCVSSDDDKGSLIVDSIGTCWYRQNVNGDLRQFGATLGSDYDCTGANIRSSAGAHGCSSNPADTILSNAQAAAKAAGVYRLTTSGVQIYLANPATLDDDLTLDGGVSSPKASNKSIDAPGTIWTTDSITSGTVGITLNNSAVLQNIAVQPHWLGQMLYDRTHNPTADFTVPDQQDVLAGMISHGQTGVSCLHSGCGVRNAVVSGYDTAVDVSAAGDSMQNVSMDGNVCAYLHDVSSGPHWDTVSCGLSATNQGATTDI